MLLIVTIHGRKTGQETTYVTWADFLSPIGCFMVQDGVGWFHHSGNLGRNDGVNVAETSRNIEFVCQHVVLFRSGYIQFLPNLKKDLLTKVKLFLSTKTFLSLAVN